MSTQTEHPRISLSAYWSAALGEIIAFRCSKPYPIECHAPSEDYKSIAAAVNQGIDAHLDGILFKQSPGDHGRTRFVFEPQSMPVLVRRLMESHEEHAESLASSICETLDIELV